MEEGQLQSEIRALRHRMDRLERLLKEAAPRRASLEEGRLPTHVEGLDDLLGGGLPVGHVVLLRGPPGSLKTSLGLQILAGSSDEGSRRLYLSLEEARESLRRTMRDLGLGGDDFIVDIASMRLEHGGAEEPRDWLQILTSYLRHKVEEGLGVLVVDSLDALYGMVSLPFPRQAVFEFFTFLREAGVTSLLLYEEPAFLHREDRLADGILEVEEREEEGRVTLWIRCPKMRHAPHSRDPHRLERREGGLAVRPPA